MNDDVRLKAKAEYDIISAENSDDCGRAAEKLVISKSFKRHHEKREKHEKYENLENSAKTTEFGAVSSPNVSKNSYTLQKSPKQSKSSHDFRNSEESSTSIEKNSGTLLSRKTDAILDHNRALLEYQKETDIVKTLQKKVGNYKKKGTQDRLGRSMGEESDIIWTTRIKLVYVQLSGFVENYMNLAKMARIVIEKTEN